MCAARSIDTGMPRPSHGSMSLHRPRGIALALASMAAVVAMAADAGAQQSKDEGTALLVTGVTLSTVGLATAVTGAVMWAEGPEAVDVYTTNANEPPHYRTVAVASDRDTAMALVLIAGSVMTAAGVPLIVLGARKRGASERSTTTGSVVLGPGSAALRGAF